MQYRGLELTEKNGDFYFNCSEKTEYQTSLRSQNLKDFMNKYDLKESRAPAISINHLLKGQVGSQTIYEDMKDYPKALGWFDHTNLFYHSKSKSYVMTTQPYDLRLDQFKALEEFCKEMDFSCAVSCKDSWHYPGATTLVIICRSKAMSTIFNQLNE